MIFSQKKLSTSPTHAYRSSEVEAGDVQTMSFRRLRNSNERQQARRAAKDVFGSSIVLSSKSSEFGPFLEIMSADEVAKAFVQHFYNAFRSGAAQLASLYVSMDHTAARVMVDPIAVQYHTVLDERSPSPCPISAFVCFCF